MAQQTTQNDDLRDKLVKYIEDMYTLETQIIETLEKHASEAKAVPEFQTRINQHIEESKAQRDRMEQRLAAYNKKPSSVKGAMGSMVGNVVGAVSGTRPDVLAMNARDEFATEHMEIAAYGLLLTTAVAYGDAETARACEQTLAEEQAMADWLQARIPQAALLSLEQGGIKLPQTAHTQGQNAWRQALHFAQSGASGMSGGMSGGMTGAGMQGMQSDGMTNNTTTQI